MGWPICGQSLAFLKPHSSNSMGTFLQKQCSKYGRIFKSHLFGSPAIVSCDQELNMFVLQNEEKLFLASYPKPMHGILGKYSLLIVSGELHKKLRNVAVSFIGSSKSTPAFLRFVEKLALSMMESWKQHKRDCEEIRKARARLSSTVRDIIKQRKTEKPGLREEDFLDVILSKQSLRDAETVSIVLDILLGGYETTTTLIPLIVYFLAHSPNVYQRLKVISESMRCGNVVKFVHREAIRDVKFKDYVIPSGWKVLPVLAGVHFDPSLHENPSEFNPRRWSNNDKATMSKTVMPFWGRTATLPRRRTC
ncbi:putative Cytochrome P450 [Melia azedarach]|uniref:Cytochrome P450 n=1 Tax=Melia azedarach TaxID=155640 RepID=A0ACC1Z0B6_MELAZ|nr:putative Cytochrome P450 [Melia azedarach]